MDSSTPFPAFAGSGGSHLSILQSSLPCGLCSHRRLGLCRIPFYSLNTRWFFPSLGQHVRIYCMFLKCSWFVLTPMPFRSALYSMVIRSFLN